MYLYLSERLTENGFIHYEISNFAKPGYEGKHNLKYWNGEEYLGIGPSAHSFLGGVRFCYPRDIKSYIIGEEPIADGTGGDEEEYIMLRLRLREGLIFNEYYEKYHKNLSDEVIEKAKLFEKQGLVTVNDTSIALTREGFLLSNTIISELIYV